MKLKKINAIISLLAIIFIILHVGFTVFEYVSFHFNPILNKVFAVPFMFLACIHGILGMCIVFTQSDENSLNLYPKSNIKTIIQRISAALIFPLLILHINTFKILEFTSKDGKWILFVLVIILEIVFFAAVIAHVSVSMTGALITLGILTSRTKQQVIDRVVYVIGAIAFVVTIIVIIKTQLVMFIK